MAKGDSAMLGPREGWVICSKELGVFLGLTKAWDDAGEAFTTKPVWAYALNALPSIPPAAPMFTTLTRALDFANEHLSQGLVSIRLVEGDVVDADRGMLYASPEACQKAGLPPWIVSDSSSENVLPV